MYSNVFESIQKCQNNSKYSKMYFKVFNLPFQGKIQIPMDTVQVFVAIRNDRETHAVIEMDDVSSLTSEVKKGALKASSHLKKPKEKHQYQP